MAFTNYLMQSIICSWFFYGYGFGFYNKLKFHELYYFVFAVWVSKKEFSEEFIGLFNEGNAMGLEYLNDIAADEAAKNALLKSEKEKSENVMVVDLVRNDLSRFCKPGTVEVEELFGVYSFPQVHQMISTVKGEITEGFSWIDAVEQCFPMGSMTGAPKHRVLELIESYELTRRGIFSGAVGYCTPDGDADFNVVIRSILYNSSSKYLSCLVGSAITWNSEAEKEYDECQLKIMAIQKALGG